MIRYYCQYSYGGFRTFRIYGEELEPLEKQEVERGHRLDFPPQGNIYFNYGGARMVFRTFDSGEVAIILRDIPGPTKDTDGRPVSCAIQIIGDKEDMPLLCKVVYAIVNDIEGFEDIFVSGFSLRGGLHYKGIPLRQFVEEQANAKYVSLPPLGDLTLRKGPVYLFVPTSDMFVSDRRLTTKVIKELSLGTQNYEIANTLANTILMRDLQDLKGRLKPAQTAPLSTDTSNEEKQGDKLEEKPEESQKETISEVATTETKEDETPASEQSIGIIVDFPTSDTAADLRKRIKQLTENETRLRKLLRLLFAAVGVLAATLIVALILK